MTRVNCAIPVKYLTDEHLIAEHCELEMLPYFHQKAIESGSIRDIPEKFTLGKGHILFFVNKMGFVRKRYRMVHKECKRRGFGVQNREDKWKGISEKYMNDYNPTPEARKILLERIIERISNSPKKNFRYMGENISKEEAIEKLKQLN